MTNDDAAAEARLGELIAAIIALEPTFREVRPRAVREALERVGPLPGRPLTRDEIEALAPALGVPSEPSKRHEDT